MVTDAALDIQPTINIYPSRQTLSEALASRVANLSERACAARGRFAIALSGGSLIDILCPPLISAPMRAAIDWSGWHLFWADERWVAKSDSESNYGLAEKRFVSHVPIPADQIYAIDNTHNPEETADRYESIIKQVLPPDAVEPPAFDLILLGIGPDGHTASLFPDHPLLAETRRWVAPVYDSPKPPPTRITMTLPLINHARQVVFVAAGGDKAAIVANILNPAAGRRLPAQLVQPVHGRLHWFIDQKAAKCARIPAVAGMTMTEPEHKG